MGRTHVFIGEGDLDLSGFFDVIEKESLKAVTLECSLTSIDNPDSKMSYNELVSRMEEARIRLRNLLGAWFY